MGYEVTDETREAVRAVLAEWANFPTTPDRIIAAVAPLIEAQARAGLWGNIERQAETITELRAELAQARAEIERLQEDVAGWQKTASDLFDERMALRAELAQARASADTKDIAYWLADAEERVAQARAAAIEEAAKVAENHPPTYDRYPVAIASAIRALAKEQP